jgi:hypothetical protein
MGSDQKFEKSSVGVEQFSEFDFGPDAESSSL